MSDPRLPQVLAALGDRLGAAPGDPVPLEGGITNRNFRVRVGDQDLVVRLPGAGTELLGIDRVAECVASQAAFRLGVGPEVVAFLEPGDVLVTRFLPGRAPQPGELSDPAVLAGVTRGLRVFHGGPMLSTTFSPFHVGLRSRRLATERGAKLPPAMEVAERVARDIHPLLGGGDHEPVPCHNDLLAGNVLLLDGGVRFLDWEYAGMGDRFFDLANLAVNNDFGPDDELALLAAYFGPRGATGKRLAVLRLMRLMSDYREAWWGILQAVVSDLDVDFEGYADTHLQRLVAVAEGPDYADWLRLAGG